MNFPELPFSAACERNKEPILRVLTEHLADAESVLEIGSGTGQHAEYFAKHLPHLVWYPSDREEYLSGLVRRFELANLANVQPPYRLDVNQSPWFKNDIGFDAIYTANTFHIMREDEVVRVFQNLDGLLSPCGQLFVYGPFKYDGVFTSASNQQFNQQLRARGYGSGIREFHWICQLATSARLSLAADIAMPVNNQCLVFERSK
ncbi:MAG: DUF938 domain-containing protein [Pseudomonadota bacterium]